jgi:hypothetical protein
MTLAHRLTTTVIPSNPESKVTMDQPETIALLRTDATEILEDFTALLAFLHQSAQEDTDQTSTNDYLNGYHKGRGTAFAQAAEWQQATVDKLRSLLELE